MKQQAPSLGISLFALLVATLTGCGSSDATPSSLPQDAATSLDGATFDTDPAQDAAVLEAAAEAGESDTAQTDAPSGDTGDSAGGPGFGEICKPKDAVPCAEGLICLWAPANKYFCTKICTSQGKVCDGAPSGMAAFCLVTNATPDGKGGCAFVCAEPGLTYQCPAALKCQTTEDPAGSGQRLCLP